MKKKSVPGLGLVFLFLSQAVFSQGIGEYGRLLGGVGQKNIPVVSKGAAPGREAGASPKSQTPGVGDVRGNSMPSVLTVESAEAVLYARSEEWADKVTELSHGEKLIPMVYTTGANTLWYMVKTQTGVIGWIKAADVNADSIRK
jgi:hypothetical protein